MEAAADQKTTTTYKLGWIAYGDEDKYRELGVSVALESELLGGSWCSGKRVRLGIIHVKFQDIHCFPASGVESKH